MIGTLIVCCALLGLENDAGGSSVGAPADRGSYESARKTAGRDAGAHVRLALWCESHGLPAERMKHLALAVLYDPSHALARGLMGLVEYRGKWGTPEDIGDRIRDDPSYRDLIREYLEKRAQAPRKADSQMRLAAWCEQKGLKAQAIAHYHEVVRLDPSREGAWRHLGYKKLGDRWVKAEDAAAAKREAELQKAADKRWRARLEKLREDLEVRDAAKRARAERALGAVTDPRAVPMIWAVLVRGDERSQLAAVQMLGQIDGPSAATALATLAILSPDGPVSGRASETLSRRDPRDIIGRLINMIRKPYKYQVRPVNGPGSTGELFVEGEQFNVRRLYRATPIDPSLIPAGFFAPTSTFDPLDNPGSGMPATSAVGDPRRAPGQGLMDALTAQAFASAGSSQGLQLARRLDNVRQENRALQQRLDADIRAIEQMNAQFQRVNDRVLPIVTSLTGQNLGVEPEKWKGWWTDQLGYAYQAASTRGKPTLTDVVDASPSWSASLECFGAGTLVRTIEGPRPIESIHVGDRLLSQKTSTGALAFQPVLAIHHTKAAATIRVNLDGESIVATGIHRFWKAGEGWAMARDLKPGDRIRAIGGVVAVRSVESGADQPVYNLDVAENHDFLVGTEGLLVHDANVVEPVSQPFDASTSVTGH